MCSQCVQQVNTSYDFKIQCETADATLKQLIGCHQSQMTLQVWIPTNEGKILSSVCFKIMKNQKFHRFSKLYCMIKLLLSYLITFQLQGLYNAR